MAITCNPLLGVREAVSVHDPVFAGPAWAEARERYVEDGHPAHWQSYFVDPTDAPLILQIRPLTWKETAEISSRRVWIEKGQTHSDEIGMAIDAFRMGVVGWSGLVDLSGQPIRIDVEPVSLRIRERQIAQLWQASSALLKEIGQLIFTEALVARQPAEKKG